MESSLSYVLVKRIELWFKVNLLLATAIQLTTIKVQPELTVHSNKVVDNIIYVSFDIALLLNETVLEIAKQQTEEASWLKCALMIG